jgi:SAM-dependent methyltransferase
MTRQVSTEMKNRQVTDKVLPLPDLNLNELRWAIQEEYQVVAESPDHGFHFHTGRPLATMLGYDEAWLNDIPAASLESFAGTGNPFSLGQLKSGERIVDVGSGAGIDSLIAARMVGPEGQVVGVDMTPAMLVKARRAARQVGLDNVELPSGKFREELVGVGWVLFRVDQAKKGVHFGQEAGPGRLLCQQDVVFAVQRHKPGPGNEGGQQPAFLKGDTCIIGDGDRCPLRNA